MLVQNCIKTAVMNSDFFGLKNYSHSHSDVDEKGKKCIFQHAGPTAILNFDLLNPKLEAFVPVPKYIDAEGSVTICPILFKILRLQWFGCTE